MRDLPFITRRLRACARLLDAATTWQRDEFLEDVLKLTALSNHLRQVAAIVDDRGLVAGAAAHRDFAVVPHAAWMARRPRGRHDRSHLRAAGKKGGASKSMSKIEASRMNGALGGRPKFDDEPFVARFVNWAHDLKSDPDYTEHVARAVVLSFPKLSVRLRRKIARRLRDRGLSVRSMLAAASRPYDSSAA